MGGHRRTLTTAFAGCGLCVAALASHEHQRLVWPLPPPAVAPADSSRSDGVCCYVCRGACGSECLGCWSRNALCSESMERCQASCGGTWCPGSERPKIPPRAPLPTPILDTPAVRWKQDGGSLPSGVPTVSGESLYVVPGNLTFSNKTPGVVVGSVHRAKVQTGELEWERPLTELFDSVNASFVHQLYRPVVSFPADGEKETIVIQVDNFLTGPSLYTLDAATGSMVWNVTIDQRLMPTGVAAGEGCVYYVTREGDLVARWAANGTMRWKKSYGGDFSAPTHLKNVVFKSGEFNAQRYVFAVGEEDGSELWATPSCTDSPCGDVSPWGQHVTASGDLVFIATTFFRSSNYIDDPDGRLQAHSAQTGHPKWAFDIDGSVGRPILAEGSGSGLVVMTSCSTQPQRDIPLPPHWWIGCTVWALDIAQDHETAWDAVRWYFTLPPDLAASEVVSKDGVVFVSTSRFVNGTWPSGALPYCTWANGVNCTFPAKDQFWANCTWLDGIPNCTWTPEQLANASLPGYVEPQIFALRAEDGALMWKYTVQNTSAPNASQFAGQWPEAWKSVVRVLKAMEGDPAALKELAQDSLGNTVMGLWCGVVGITSGWSPAPWGAFSVDTNGQTLVYSTLEGVFAIDVSARAFSGDALDKWVWPMAMTAAGVAFVVLMALFSLRCFAVSPAGEEVFEGDTESDEPPTTKVAESSGSTSSPGHSRVAESGSGSGSSAQQQQQQGYQVLRQLGHGAFGTVFLVRRRDTEEQFSLKRIDCRTSRELRVARHEVKMLRELKSHPGLIRVVESFATENAVFIVMPYFEKGDLASYIVNYPSPVIPEATVVSFVTQLCEVMVHLHGMTPQVAHRDLKPENILMSNDLKRIVVTDFGLARLVDQTYMHTHAGTMAFMAPEAFGGPYDTKVDIWSIGCIIYTMSTRRVRNCKVMCVHVGRKGFYQEVADAILSQGYSALVVDLVRQMLQVNRHARPSAEEVLFRLGGDAPPPLRLGEAVGMGEAKTPPAPAAPPPPRPPPVRLHRDPVQLPPPGRPFGDDSEAPITRALRTGESASTATTATTPFSPTMPPAPLPPSPAAEPARAAAARLPPCASDVPAPSVLAPKGGTAKAPTVGSLAEERRPAVLPVGLLRGMPVSKASVRTRSTEYHTGADDDGGYRDGVSTSQHGYAPDTPPAPPAAPPVASPVSSPLPLPRPGVSAPGLHTPSAAPSALPPGLLRGILPRRGMGLACEDFDSQLSSSLASEPVLQHSPIAPLPGTVGVPVGILRGMRPA
eukprot:TRINITY_DN5236_c1_g2_i1.p1 TRINITY_DN5236_c1_g2~~TRINITY_DN5236_c1_g2_i1.p1  ORF type:complete len:1270 (+),score=379.09 TRINITY_DN5236_c1_g2_i1:300-4109(+)